MIRRPPRSTRTDTLFPYTTLFRSVLEQFGDIGRLRVAVVDDDPVIGADAEVDRLVRVEFGRLQSLAQQRSEEHTSELQSLMRISYAVFCLKKKNKRPRTNSKSNK